MLTYTVAAGMKSTSHDNLFSGISPKVLIVGLVSNESFNGTYKTNPFKFEHFNLTSATLYVNGDPLTYKLDFANKICKRAYVAMFQSLNMLNTDESNGLTYEKWTQDHPLLVYNLCPDLVFDGEHGQVKSRPNIRLELQFAAAPTKSFNVILLAITDGIVTINKDRNVSLDY